jgi:hypothetical protein
MNISTDFGSPTEIQQFGASMGAPVSQPTTMFGGDIPAVQFHAITPDSTPRFHSAVYTAKTSPTWSSPFFSGGTGSKLNVIA